MSGELAWVRTHGAASAYALAVGAIDRWDLFHAGGAWFAVTAASPAVTLRAAPLPACSLRVVWQDSGEVGLTLTDENAWPTQVLLAARGGWSSSGAVVVSGPEFTALFEAWAAQAGAPGRVSGRRVNTFLAKTRVCDADRVVGLLGKLLGFVAEPQHDFWKLLGGATGPSTVHHQWVVGTSYTMDTNTRWAAAAGKGFQGMWDRDAPEAPVLTFPAGDEGRAALNQAWAEIVEEPLWRDARLNGARIWATAVAPRDATSIKGLIIDFDEQAGRVLYLLARFPLGAFEMYPLTRRSDYLKPPATLDTLDRCADEIRGYLRSWELGSWHPIPDSVDRTIHGTVTWVIAAAATCA